ncbi:MAG TPA: hypothetical protein VHK01_01720 [Lacipirellulaceae bacterium]|nr:hypothetical protein [Lacipirellulaceae bacterium]
MFNCLPFCPSLARWALVGTVCVLVIRATSGTARAAGTIISTGFESPYTAGPLQGQFGWVSAGSGTSSATVQNSIKLSGSQAVQVVRAANSDRRWAVQLAGFPTQSLVAIDWDMRVSQTPGSTSFGPFFGIEAYDDAGQPLGLLGSLGVDATTGDVLYQIQDSGVFTETGQNVLFNQWHHYRVLLDFSTDTYRGYFDGNLVASTGFVDRSFNLNDFTDADISAIAAAGDPASLALASSAVFDNLVIRDGFGDYDVDGDIDTADYALWRTSFGQSVQYAGNGADGNNNGVVDAADYVVWRKRFGASPSSGAGSANLVPEPASLFFALMSLQVIAIATARRQRPL